MNAKELQIGDWVENDLGEIQQVIELHEDKVMLAYNDLYLYDAIKPIPLTPKILEKNSISPKNTGDTYAFHYLMDDVSIVECHANAGSRCRCIIAYGETRLRITIRFVHELQHTLRLCGIEKDIELQ